MLLKKFFNVGFEIITVVERRALGIADLTRYPLFAPEFLEFLREKVSAEYHNALVSAVTITARKPGSDT